MEKNPYRSRSKAYQSPRLSAFVWSLAVLAVLAPLVPVQLLLAAQHVGAVPSIAALRAVALEAVPLLAARRVGEVLSLCGGDQVFSLLLAKLTWISQGWISTSMGTMIALRLRETISLRSCTCIQANYPSDSYPQRIPKEPGIFWFSCSTHHTHIHQTPFKIQDVPTFKSIKIPQVPSKFIHFKINIILWYLKNDSWLGNWKLG